MKLEIGGKVYDMELGFRKASLQTLYVLGKEYGVTVKDLEAQAERMVGKSVVEVASDPEALHALMVMIWLGRRYAGETVTMEESSSFPLDDLKIVVDGQAPEEAADPKATAASLQADVAEPASSSKTSKPPSTKTS